MYFSSENAAVKHFGGKKNGPMQSEQSDSTDILSQEARGVWHFVLACQNFATVGVKRSSNQRSESATDATDL